MKLALHRSITFWSGFLVMGFIVWCWGDSSRSVFIANIRYSQVKTECGTVAFFYYPSDAPYSWDQVSFDRDHLNEGFFAHFGGAPFFFRGGGELDTEGTDPFSSPEFDSLDSFWRREPLGSWAFGIPHWLLLLAVALPWTALLLWRARRRRKIISA